MSEKFCNGMQEIIDQLTTTLDELKDIGKTMSSEDCGKKIFYFALESNMEETLIRLRKYFPNIPFYKGKSKFHMHRLGWKIAQTGFGVFQRIGYIVQSGLYKFLKKLTLLKSEREIEILKERYNKEEKLFRPQSLDSNGVIMFYLLIIALGMSMLVFLLEKMSKYYSHVGLYEQTVVVKF